MASRCLHENARGLRCPDCGRRVPREATEEAPETGSTIAGYRIESLLGAGGEARVFLARDANDARVALKVLHSSTHERRARLANEAAMMQRAGRHVAPAVLGIDVDGEVPFLAMEAVSGDTLASALASDSITTESWRSLALDIVSVVGACHDAGVLHLDIKPENIILCEEGVRLLDFGLARGCDAETVESVIIRGTAETMAPELDRGAVSVAADLYSLTVVLFETLVGRPPFTGLATIVRGDHARRRPPPASFFGPGNRDLDAVFSRGLAKAPSERFASANDLAQALTRASEHLRHREGPPSALPRLAVMALTGEPPDSLAELERKGDVTLVRRDSSTLAVFSDAARISDIEGLARTLSDSGATALLDILPVSTVVSRRGGRRVASAGFSRMETLLPTLPAGVTCTAQARSSFRRAGLSSSTTSMRARGAGLFAFTADAFEKPPRQGELPFVGREELAATLAAGDESFVLVTADPGLGKTRLADELARIRTPSESAVRVPSRAERGSFLERFLEATFGSRDPALLEQQVVASFGDSQLARGAWLGIAAAFGFDDTAILSRRAEAAEVPGSLREMAVGAAMRVLRTRAETQPLLVLIDDLAREDDGCLDIVERLRQPSANLSVVAFARPELRHRRPAWFAEEVVHTLAPLSSAAAETLIHALLLPATDVPPAIVSAIEARCAGVPLALVSLGNALHRDGQIRRRARGESWVLAEDAVAAVPPQAELEWYVDRELRSLGPELAAHAALIACLPQPVDVFDIVGVTRCLDAEGPEETIPLDASVAIRELEDAMMLERAGQAVRFRNAAVRDEIRRTMRRDLVSIIGEAAVRFFSASTLESSSDLELVGLASAATSVQRRDTASAAYSELATRRRRRHDYHGAARAFGRALDQLAAEDKQARLDAVWGRGLMRYRTGRYTDSVEDLTAASELAGELGNRRAEAEILLDKAEALDWMDSLESSEMCVRAARQILSDHPEPRLAVRVALADGRTSFRNCDWPAAARALERALDDGEAHGAQLHETLVIARLLLGPVYASQGRLDAAARVFAEAIEMCAARGDRIHHAAALNNRITLRAAEGDFEAAMADANACIEIGRELGVLSFEFSANLNVAELLCLAGRSEEAGPLLARALEYERRRSPRRTAAVLEARWHLHRGARAEARAAREALLRGEPDSSERLQPRDHLLLDMIDVATRDASELEWDAVCEAFAARGAEQEPVEIWLVRATAAAEHGRHEDAARFAALGLAVAETIPTVMVGRLEALASPRKPAAEG